MQKIDIIVGGQFGSEGKGKVAYFLAQNSDHKCVARVGGSNSGHTIKNFILRHLPASALISNGLAIIGAGSYIDVDVLLSEIDKIAPPNLFIDENASIICSSEPIILKEKIGSTLSGTGEAVIERVFRISAILAKSVEKLQKYIINKDKLYNLLSSGCIVEGTQGFGLSLLHSPHFPFVTSRDTTAAGFISELGVSPREVRNIYLVIRTFPIRVGGNSGPLLNECQWTDVGVAEEFTSVTRRQRRVGKFDPIVVRMAIKANNPTHIILNHLDYIPTNKRESFIKYVEDSIGRKVNYIGLGPNKLLLR